MTGKFQQKWKSIITRSAYEKKGTRGNDRIKNIEKSTKGLKVTMSTWKKGKNQQFKEKSFQCAALILDNLFWVLSKEQDCRVIMY